jgi:hypothetical protein
MSPVAIAESDIALETRSPRGYGLVGMQMNFPALHAAPQSRDEHVVHVPGVAVHADARTGVLSPLYLSDAPKSLI